jgi:hypothetical protein
MRITSGGNVGIGTSSPSARLDVFGSGNTAINSKGNLFVSSGGTASQASEAGGQISFGAWLNGDLSSPYPLAAIRGVTESGSTNVNGGALIFGVGNSGTTVVERMRITTDGAVLVGATAAPSSSTSGVALQNPRLLGPTLFSSGNVSDSRSFVQFINANGVVGQITTSGTSTSYVTSSDYRLKQDLKDYNGLDLVSAIKSYDYEWKSDSTRSYGVIAHELQDIIPQAVYGEKDADEMQGVDYSKIVPILIKSIQELQAKIVTLESKIN